MIKNDYIVIGDIAIVTMRRKNGEVFKTIIDKEDLELLSSLNSKFRVSITYDKCTYAYCKRGLLHRLITKAPKGKCVDHINHNSLDNRKSNLRIVTDVENQQNRRGPQRNNTSGVYGVNWRKTDSKWEARFMFNGIRYSVGQFGTKEEAAKALQRKKKEVIGF